jgi:hypothetical protein
VLANFKIIAPVLLIANVLKKKKKKLSGTKARGTT